MDKCHVIDQKKLSLMAKLAIETGLGLREGQDLIITAPIESLPLVRLLTAEAYKSGAGLVTPFFSDSEITLARYKYATDASFDKAASWLYRGMGEAFDNNTARMAVVGEDPMLLADQNPDKVGRANKANSIAYKPARERITQFQINWNLIPWPGKSWSNRMFPELNSNEAQNRLAEAIFLATRVNEADPIEAWREHNKSLRKKSDWLNKKDFYSLHFMGPNTDLTVGLADEHEWMGGASLAQNNIVCNPNIPSEEVFTTPHALRVDGTVISTKPLSHQGTLIEDIRVRFENGRIVEASASKGEQVLIKVLDTDEGARRLGEVALVPESSPIAQSGLLFYNTLFDENAACHIALGQCYSKCFKSDRNLSQNELSARGGNSSMIHIDWMIGSKHINIDGITKDNQKVPIFRDGEWV
ncbi:MAG: aminopeptidase [Pseudomonadota bacterium]|nr:aminopeptidase [Pseudomonadota bacterium]